jgi:hypothetical protein
MQTVVANNRENVSERLAGLAVSECTKEQLVQYRNADEHTPRPELPCQHCSQGHQVVLACFVLTDALSALREDKPFDVLKASHLGSLTQEEGFRRRQALSSVLAKKQGRG